MSFGWHWKGRRLLSTLWSLTRLVNNLQWLSLQMSPCGAVKHSLISSALGRTE